MIARSRAFSPWHTRIRMPTPDAHSVDTHEVLLLLLYVLCTFIIECAQSSALHDSLTLKILAPAPTQKKETIEQLYQIITYQMII